jgi:hypothetical protein
MNIFVSLGLCVVQSIWANSKGYNPIAWFLTAGPVGWIFLAIQKNINKMDASDEVKAKRKKDGDLVGWIYSGVIIFVIILFLAMNNR